MECIHERVCPNRSHSVLLMKERKSYLIVAVASVLSFFGGIGIEKYSRSGIDFSIAQNRGPLKTKYIVRDDHSQYGSVNTNIAVTEMDRLARVNDLGLLSNDPAQALAFLRRRSKGRIDEQLIRVVFESWAAKNAAEAFAVAQSPENTDIQFIATDAVLGAVLASSPDDALGMLLSLEPSGFSQSLTTSLFRKLAVQDVALLKGKLGEIKSPSAKALATAAVALELGQANPEQGLKWIDSLKGDSNKRDALASLLNGWAKIDPKAAATYLDSQNPSVLSPTVSSLFLSQWALSDPASAFEWAKNIKGVTERQFAVSNVMMYMQAGSFSSQETLAAVTSLPAGRMKDEALANIINNWKGDDFTELAKTAYADGSDVPGTASEAALAYKWVSSNYEEASAFLDTLSSKDLAPALLREVTKGMIQNEPDKAVGVLTQMASEGNLAIVPSALEAFFNADSEDAKAFMTNLEGTPRYNETLTMFAAAYANQNPRDAYEWIENNVDDGLKSAAVRVVIDQWLRTDQHSASEFISNMPESLSRDVASSTLAASIAKSDLPSALEWASAIRSDEIRRESLGKIGQYVDFKHPDKYSEAILSSGLCSDDIQYLEQER